MDNSEMKGITADDLETNKSRTILYLQYLSISLSIIFSITGIYWFLFANEQKKSEVIEKTIVEKNTTIIQEKPVNYIIDGLEMGSFIWHKDTKRGVNFKEGNDYCANLEPKGIWRIPSFDEISDTHIDINGVKIVNNILTSTGWYIMKYMGSSSIPVYYNSKINTSRTANPLSNRLAGEDVIVKCITERNKIYPDDYGRFPGCDSDNIELSNGQIWAACNLGAKKAWDGSSKLQLCDPPTNDCNQDKEWRGNYYQFGSISWEFVSESQMSQKYGELQGYYSPLESKHTWEEFQKFHSSICPAGWHIPTIEEWRSAYIVTGNSIANLRGKLLLPPTGYREPKNGHFMIYTTGSIEQKSLSQAGNEEAIYYWSADSSYIDDENVKNGTIFLINFHDSGISGHAPIIQHNPSYYGYNIRCIANNL